jgi:hypothetical protein
MVFYLKKSGPDYKDDTGKTNANHKNCSRGLDIIYRDFKIIFYFGAACKQKGASEQKDKVLF